LNAITPQAAPLLAGMAACIPRWQTQAADHDAASRFPRAELHDLHDMGAFLAPLPAAVGGAGMGTEPRGGHALFELLRLIGQGNLAVGRLYEGHVNALALIARYGTAAQTRAAAADAAAGHLFAIWNTAPPEDVRLGEDGVLRGKKIFCSAAGQATRALITAQARNGEARMLLVPLAPGERVGPDHWEPQGMRACGSGSMVFDGHTVSADELIGSPGDYLRQPLFSAGAWRTSAVTVGGLAALVAEARAQLVARRRDGAPQQRARIGAALIAQESALLWGRKAAQIAEDGTAAGDDVSAYVNLARIAIEMACLEAMRLVQRSIGLAGLIQGNALERMLRDLATYLRQPAPDETLDEAAAHFMKRDIP
jgi:alkylation response protein AidB-like acyl-CoA dehydrogenase